MKDTMKLETVALEALRRRLTSTLPVQIRKCVEELSDEQLWWRPNQKSNSVGNLILHVCGSVRHFICLEIGGIEYQRDRPAEFAESGPIPKQELLSLLDETVEQVKQSLGSFEGSRFLSAPGEAAFKTNFDLIVNVAVHVAAHVGQIVYVTKALEEGAVDELWIRSHRA